MTESKNPLVGAWRLVRELAWNGAGEPQPPLYGPMGMGLLAFTSGGRMMVVLSDGRPDPIEGARASHLSYSGTYTFDGSRLVTHVDGASETWLFKQPQVRAARFEDGRLCLRPPIGARGASDLARELVWDRILTEDTK